MSPHVPVVYVEEQIRWQYRQVVRGLEKEDLPTEKEFNELGKHGWELTGILVNKPVAYFYFRRPAK